MSCLVSGQGGIKGSTHLGLGASPHRAYQTSDCQASGACVWWGLGWGWVDQKRVGWEGKWLGWGPA